MGSRDCVQASLLTSVINAGVTQIDYQGDAEKSTVKQSLISSYNRLLAPQVKAGLSAAVARDAAQTGKHPRKPNAAWYLIQVVQQWEE